MIFGVVSVRCWAKLDFMRESYSPLWIFSGQNAPYCLIFSCFYAKFFGDPQILNFGPKFANKKCPQFMIACSIWNTPWLRPSLLSGAQAVWPTHMCPWCMCPWCMYPWYMYPWCMYPWFCDQRTRRFYSRSRIVVNVVHCSIASLLDISFIFSRVSRGGLKSTSPQVQGDVGGLKKQSEHFTFSSTWITFIVRSKPPPFVVFLCLVQRNQSWRCNNLSPDLSFPAQPLGLPGGEATWSTCSGTKRSTVCTILTN